MGVAVLGIDFSGKTFRLSNVGLGYVEATRNDSEARLF